MKSREIQYIGGIFFFIGLIFILISWFITYPIYMPKSDEILFTQIYPSIWPGMILSLLGLFLIGCISNKRSIKIICASIFPIILYSYMYYFYLLPTSDSGSAKAMFEVFHYTGINTSVESYFHFPIFFTLNEMISQILGFSSNNLATLLFIVFGILISLYIYLFIFKNTENDIYQITFLVIPIYFIATFPYINYQWVPQTLALVFFLLLLLLFNQKKYEYKFLSIIIFTVLVFTHIFIPAIYLIFLAVYSIKKIETRNIFLLMLCIYITVLIYHTTYFLPDIINVFRESVYGFGTEYAIKLSKSLMEPIGLISQIISLVNRTIIPLTWILLFLGFLFWFIKRKISYPLFALSITSGIYLGIGMFYSILGMRALQILCISLLIGIGFFISKWKKPTLLLVTIIIVLSIFGPMRSTYDGFQFQLNEEENACNFLANKIPAEKATKIAMGGIHYGYFLRKYNYLNIDKNYSYSWVLAPRNPEFYDVFNISMEENEYIIYNSNLYKEIIYFGMNNEEVNIIKEKMLNNNKIFVCNETYIFVGLFNIPEKNDTIKPDSSESPIRKYFTTQKIIWTFDDYFIGYNYYPPHKGYSGLTEQINSYGGNVNIMTYFTSINDIQPFNNEISNYSVINDFKWSQEKINESLKFFSREKVNVGCHGWIHSDDLNYATLDYAYKIINYTFWNWKNNYNITPHFFLGPSTSGNYNITLALKKFSENYWPVYGENFRAYNTTLFPTGSEPAIEYIAEAPYVALFDPLFGRNWGNPCKNLQEAQKLYNDSTQNKEIIFIRGHPDILNNTDQKTNLTLWQQWIDWIYKTHELININHTQAIQYNHDRNNFIITKNSNTNYTIDLTQCRYNHNLTFTSPYNNDIRTWQLNDENGKYIGKIQKDTYLNLKPGLKYYFTVQ